MNNTKLIFSSDIQDIYEFATGTRFVVNKFTVGEQLHLPTFCEDKLALAGSHHISALSQDWYCTQENRKYKKGTYLYKSCEVIPTTDTSLWGYNIISNGYTLCEDGLNDSIAEIKKIVASYVFNIKEMEAAS